MRSVLEAKGENNEPITAIYSGYEQIEVTGYEQWWRWSDGVMVKATQSETKRDKELYVFENSMWSSTWYLLA